MIILTLAAMASAAGAPPEGAPRCTPGDFISVCDFVPARSGAYRIASEAHAAAGSPGAHRLTTEYRINGAACTGEARWKSGTGTASAHCVVRLEAHHFYHIVAVASAAGADRRGQVGLAIAPSSEAPTLAPG